jgi:HrpA-like RNA helicase
VGTNSQRSDERQSGKALALPIYSILDTIGFGDHFVILGDVGTGKSTVTPIREFEVCNHNREIVIREPSRASCNALYYSLCALHPGFEGDLAVITRDTRINASGKIKIVTDGVLLRMLAENSLRETSIYFDESHQMTSQLELCMSLAKKNNASGARNLFRVMSATLDPKEFLDFLGIEKLYSISGRKYAVRLELELAKDLDEMFNILSLYLYSQPRNESWLVFLPTRRLVEKYARSYHGVFIHGGLEGSEINNIQQRAELDKNLKIFATNVIASSVNIYVDNVLIFNELVDGKDKLGQKHLEYKSIDNNSLLQMMGRIGRFKPGRAVILSDVPVPKRVEPKAVRKALESETPFDLVLLMSKYGLDFMELEFISRLKASEVEFAQDWLSEIGAVDVATKKITEKGILMSEIPFEVDYAHAISSALIEKNYDVARFLLAAGSFGDSLNHAYRSESEAVAREFLYAYDKKNELNIKATLLKNYSEDRDGSYIGRLVSNGIFPRFVEEAWKNFEAAKESLNDILSSSGLETIPREVLTDVPVSSLEEYLSECLTFAKYDFFELNQHDIHDLEIEGEFFARSLRMNYRPILYDIVALDSP